MSSMSSLRTDRTVSRWLLLMIVLVIGMIVLGGATRLTNSGLSMTEWNIVSGIIPPMNDAEWLAEFAKYQKIPEFLAEHPDMTVEGFKNIFFWEWAHRVYGRIIGLAFAIPFLYFWAKGRLQRGGVVRLVLTGILIGVQGLIGKYMVESGFVENRVDVSPYRLAAHLGTAFVILGLLYWLWKDQKEGWSFRSEPAAFSKHAAFIAILVFLQIVAGAFVAGIHAGRKFNDWPMMNGQFFPQGYQDLTPGWRNLFENAAATQFNHRILAYTLVVVVALYWIRVRRFRKIRTKATMLMILLAAQIGLGIWALMMVVPLHLALAHQFLAIFVFISAIGLWRGAKLGY